MTRTQIDEYTIWSGARRFVAVAETMSGWRATGPERVCKADAEHDIPNLIYEVQTQEAQASRISDPMY